MGHAPDLIVQPLLWRVWSVRIFWLSFVEKMKKIVPVSTPAQCYLHLSTPQVILPSVGYWGASHSSGECSSCWASIAVGHMQNTTLLSGWVGVKWELWTTKTGWKVVPRAAVRVALYWELTGKGQDIVSDQHSSYSRLHPLFLFLLDLEREHRTRATMISFSNDWIHAALKWQWIQPVFATVTCFWTCYRLLYETLLFVFIFLLFFHWLLSSF